MAELDPNRAALPDYAAPEFDEDRQSLIAAGLTEPQAIKALWVLQNNKEKAVLNRRREEKAIAEAEARERKQLAEKQRAEEQAQILWEERKKYPTKFAPIPDVPVPSEPMILPSQVAIRKIQQRKFCELWYFTNEGLDEADASPSYAPDDDTFSIVLSAEGLPTLVPASSVHNKANVTQDEELSMEQFSQASIRMLNFVNNYVWDHSHVDMYVAFWSAIKNHRWRYSRNENQQRALLVYQGQQRRHWHDCITSPRAFDLSIIDEDLLRDTFYNLMVQIRTEQANIINSIYDECNSLLAKRSAASSHASSSQAHLRSFSVSKRPISPPGNQQDVHHKRQRSFRTQPTGIILAVCAVCLGRHRHNIAHCNASRTWDQECDTFAERLGGALFSRQDGKQICCKWQRNGGCAQSHCPLHICSGCGSRSHGAQLCPRAQRAPYNDVV